ncbi:hypothetical protein FRB93_013477 [Tulasnella sp. JGI-2019a]|nr:hypothetical protein FRB93_013477 [Tulasnella sp. JGI-2019a]
MPGSKTFLGVHFNKFDYETVQKAYDMWLFLTKTAPLSYLLYEFLDYNFVASIPVDATALAHRTLDKTAFVGCMGFLDLAFVPEAQKLSEEIQKCMSSSSTESARSSIGYINYADHLAVDNATDVNAMGVWTKLPSVAAIEAEI